MNNFVKYRRGVEHKRVDYKKKSIEETVMDSLPWWTAIVIVGVLSCAGLGQPSLYIIPIMACLIAGILIFINEKMERVPIYKSRPFIDFVNVDNKQLHRLYLEEEEWIIV